MPLAADDVVAIQQLVADYNHLIDSGQAEAWADLFVPDGSLDAGHTVASGRDELVEFARSTSAMLPGIRHLVANVSVDGEGGDAHVTAHLQAWNATGNPAETTLLMTGVYHDTLRRVDGVWRFVDRRLVPDAGTPLPLGTAVAGRRLPG